MVLRLEHALFALEGGAELLRLLGEDGVELDQLLELRLVRRRQTLRFAHQAAARDQRRLECGGEL